MAPSATQQTQNVDLTSGAVPTPPDLVNDISPISTSDPPVIPLLPNYEEEALSTGGSAELGPEPDIELRVPEEGWDAGLELDYIEDVQGDEVNSAVNGLILSQ